MDFIKDLRTIAEVLLDHYGLDHLATEDAIDVIRRWVNVHLKLIKTLPRKVFVAPNVDPQALNVPIQQALRAIEMKFVNGADVNGHLSKSIFKEDYTDYLYYDWGIHHLHLSTTQDPTNPFFTQRSDKLLFVTLNDSSVYFIDVRDHDEDYVFAQKALLKVIHDNWPEVVAPYRLKGLDIEQDISNPEDIHKLRKAGVTIIYKVGDAIYAPAGGGITTAATSVKVTTESDKLVRMAREAQQWASENSADLLRDINSVYPKQDQLDLHLDLNDKGFFVVDMTSKVGWQVKF